MSRKAVLTVLALVATGVGLGALVWFAPAIFVRNTNPQPPPQLKVGGTATVYIMVENRWRSAYRHDKGIDVKYESTGSTKGLGEMIDNNFTIAFTHAPMTEDQRKKAKEKGGDVVHIPVVLCAVVPVYNLPDLDPKAPPLRFTADILARIFLGKIEHWDDDEELNKLNEKVKLPHIPINVVYREDSSGTTTIFVDYLQGASTVWQQWRKENPGGDASKIKWPSGAGKDRNEGVANYVQRTPGTIGYVELVHAVPRELSFGDVQNAESQNAAKKEFVRASAETMTAAAREALGTISDDLTFSLTNQKGKNSYPITGAIWAVCYQKQPAARQKDVVDFLHWVLHEGQPFAARTEYAPLPEELAKRADERLKLIQAQ